MNIKESFDIYFDLVEDPRSQAHITYQLSNILKVINPDHLELCLYGIFSNVLKCKMKIGEKQICIDGKTICSTATMKKHEKPMHIITALLADESVSLGQITVESKSNEIPAVRELIELLNIKGAVLTMDACIVKRKQQN